MTFIHLQSVHLNIEACFRKARLIGITCPLINSTKVSANLAYTRKVSSLGHLCHAIHVASRDLVFHGGANVLSLMPYLRYIVVIKDTIHELFTSQTSIYQISYAHTLLYYRTE